MDSSARFVGGIPDYYDRGLGPILFADYADDLARRVAALGPSRVLETAAGTGIATRKLRDALPAATALTSTDLNPPMLEIARAKFKPGEQVDLQPADATALPFTDGSFDAVACQFGVMFYPDKQRCYHEVFRVLSPGGHYVFNVWDSHDHNPFGRISHAVAGRFFATDPPRFYAVPFSYYELDQIQEAMLEAGFAELRIDVLASVKEIPDVDGFARAAVYGNPLVDQIRARGGVDPDRVVEAFAEAYRREFGSNPALMPLQAIVVCGRRPA